MIDEFNLGAMWSQNSGTTILPLLLGSHWAGVEIIRGEMPPRVVIVQVPPQLQQRAIFFICWLLQIPAHRLDVVYEPPDEIPGMCGRSLIYRRMQIFHAQ